MTRVLIASLVGFALASGTVRAQAPSTPPVASQAPAAAAAAPVLPDDQKLIWQRILTRVAEDRYRAAQAELEYLKATRDLEAAKAEAGATVTAWQRPGFDLDLEQLVYVKKPEAAKKEPPK